MSKVISTELRKRLFDIENKCIQIKQTLEESPRLLTETIGLYEDVSIKHTVDYVMVDSISKILNNYISSDVAERLKEEPIDSNTPSYTRDCYDYIEPNRTGIGTLKTVGLQVVLNSTEIFPMMVGKRVNPRLALVEFAWMLQGRTDIKWLNDNDVNYWNSWQDENGTIGKSYGYQMGKNIHSFLETFATDINSRRHLISLWNHDDLSEMVLPPCIYSYQLVPKMFSNGFYTVDLIVNARSCDIFVGGPYDWMFAAYFLKLAVTYFNVKNISNGIVATCDNIIFNVGDAHIYENQLDSIEEYLDNIQSIINNKNQLAIEFDWQLVVFYEQLYKIRSRHADNSHLLFEQYESVKDQMSFIEFFISEFVRFATSIGKNKEYKSVFEAGYPKCFSFDANNDYKDYKLSDFKEIKTPIAI